jgi:integrase
MQVARIPREHASGKNPEAWHLAGIGKKDARGRVLDIHALRHAFCTHLALSNVEGLSAVGVHPRTAMAAMRHSRIELTMNYYTDPVLLDVAGAVEKLPEFAGAGKTRHTAVHA